MANMKNLAATFVGVAAIFGFTNHLKIRFGFEQLGQSLSHNGVVIHED